MINLREDETRVYASDEAHCRPDTFRGAVVCGAHSRPFIIDNAEQAHVIGVHFEPGGAFPFLGLPAGELLDRHVSLVDVWGREAGALREKILTAPTAEWKLRVLEQALILRARRGPARHPAVAIALSELAQAPHEAVISRTVARTGLSQRRFIELFRREVGLTPKVFTRVGRFQALVRRLGAGDVDWAELAYDFGYSDQSHFNHDFRALCGMTPGQYLARRGESPNHVRMDAPAL